MVNTQMYKRILDDVNTHDNLYLFLKNVFRIYPEDAFFELIKNETQEGEEVIEIYNSIQEKLETITPKFADFRYGIPALKKQKKVLAEQTKQLFDLNEISPELNGYLEMGTTGRHVKDNVRNLNIKGDVIVVNDVEPTNGVPDLLERGGFAKKFSFKNLNQYEPLGVKDDSLDMISCYIGLHHIPDSELFPFIESISKKLRKGGFFVLRDHDCTSGFDI